MGSDRQVSVGGVSCGFGQKAYWCWRHPEGFLAHLFGGCAGCQMGPLQEILPKYSLHMASPGGLGFLTA